MNHEKNFDLTTKEGVNSVSKILAMTNPLIAIPYFIFNSKRTEDQSEVVEKLIKKGKEIGIDEMEIKIDNSKGIDLNLPLEDVEIRTRLGNDEKTYIKVKYK